MKPDVSERAHIEEELQVIGLEESESGEEVVEMTPGRVFTFDDETFKKSQDLDKSVEDVHICRRIKRSRGFGSFEPPRGR